MSRFVPLAIDAVALVDLLGVLINSRLLDDYVGRRRHVQTPPRVSQHQEASWIFYSQGNLNGDVDDNVGVCVMSRNLGGACKA